MLDQGAADLVGDALGFAGGAGRIEYVKRVVEFARYEFDFGDRVGDYLVPVNGVYMIAESGKVDLDDGLNTRYLGADAFYLVGNFVSLTV
jgi:hypothetical protein